MHFRLALGALFVAAALAACGGPRQASYGSGTSGGGSSGDRLSSNLAAVVSDVATAAQNGASGNISGARTLPHDIGVLTRAIDSGTVDADGVILLRFYRALARQTLNALNESLTLPVDRNMAEAALADYEIVAAVSDEKEDLREMKRSAIYGAGQVLINFLNNEPRAYNFFARCAEMKHAGCLNVMAEAKTIGVAGIKPDLKEAVALHVEVYQTGTDYTCAGVFSAYSIARIVHFTDVRPDANDEFVWIRKVYRLLDQIKVNNQGREPCGNFAFQVGEYLMRLEGGENRPDPIREVLMKEELSETERVMIRYLLDEADDREFQAKVLDKKRDSVRCDYAFLGLWKSAISKRMEAVRNYHRLMEGGKGDDSCAQNLLFARKLLS